MYNVRVGGHPTGTLSFFDLFAFSVIEACHCRRLAIDAVLLDHREIGLDIRQLRYNKNRTFRATDNLLIELFKRPCPRHSSQRFPPQLLCHVVDVQSNVSGHWFYQSQILRAEVKEGIDQICHGFLLVLGELVVHIAVIVRPDRWRIKMT